MIVITSIKKLKQKNIHTTSFSPVETPGSARRTLSAPNYSDNSFCNQTDDAANFQQ